VGRAWPETYEFPACEQCNADGRYDEQVLAVLVRIGPAEMAPAALEEWKRFWKGVLNNSRDVAVEMMSMSANDRRRSLRESFGPIGDQMRLAGWGSMRLGLLTQDAIGRFMVKLGRALYYRHNNVPFQGVIYANHFNTLSKAHTPALIESLLRIAPMQPELKRANQDLSDQFIYRFNHNAEHGAMYAVVQFSEQMIFQILAMRWEMSDQIDQWIKEKGIESPFQRRVECRLSQTDIHIPIPSG
jgi:hypothetical protein